MVVTIDELLHEHFLKRQRKDQVKIMAEGRPRPHLRVLVPGTNGMLKPFDNAIYDKEVWLSGCDKRNCLFCWTCVLVTLEGNQWNVSVFCEFKSLSEQIQAHKNSLSHLNGMLQFHQFLKQNSLPTCISSEKIQKNINVKNNSEALKRIIDVVCLMVSQASPPRERNNQCNLLNPADCVTLLNLTKTYDDHDVADEAIQLVQNCPKVVGDVVTVLASFIKQAINKETKFSTFVSLVLSEHRDVEAKSKLSTVVRYVRDGKIFESFLGFTNLDVEKTNIVVKKHIVSVVTELELSNKFLALSSDGAVPSAKYMYSFLTWLRKRHPETLYVPCHFHDFNSVLQQTLSEYPECKLFFTNLKSLKACFESNSRMCSAFSDFAGRGFPDISNLKLTDSQFLKVLRMHRQQFVQFCNSLAEAPEEWSEEELVKAICFQRVLEEYQTVFLLETFFQLFDRTAFLNEMLSSCHPESVFETGVLDGVIEDLKKNKEDGFEQLWTLAITEIIEDNKSDMLMSAGEEETQQLYQLFLKIMDCVIQSIQMRFTCAKKLNFLGILDYENRDKFVISDYYLENMVDCQLFYFDQGQLEIEMKVLLKYGWVIGRKSVRDLLEFFRRKNLHATLKNLYRLAEFIVTLPCKPTCPTNSSAKFDSIRAWASFSETSEMDCLGLLSVEHDQLEYLKSRVQFYDEVILELKNTLKSMFSDCSKAETSENELFM